jgi:hypothetical protein
MGFVGPLQSAAFLTEETIAGPGATEFLTQNGLGAVVGGTDKVSRSLE